MGTPRLGVAVIAVSFAFMLTAAACGEPGGPGTAFVFDPVPYTVIPEEDRCANPVCGITIAVDERGQRYFSDRVDVDVRHGESTALMAWAKAQGFEVIPVLDQPQFDLQTFTLAVPPGSALDAAAVVAKLDGVLNATPPYLGSLN